MSKRSDKNEAAKIKESIEQIKLIRTFLIIIIILVIIIAALAAALKITSSTKEKAVPELTSTMINQQLESCSNLVAAELTYNGLIHFSEGDIPIINQNSFSMIYTATAKAGIDISKAATTVTDTEIIILLPACEVQEINVDADSLEFYDERTSIFNRSEKTDVVTAIKYAEDDVRAKADLDSLITRAQNQTEQIIRGVIKPVAEDREIIIRYSS